VEITILSHYLLNKSNFTQLRHYIQVQFSVSEGFTNIENIAFCLKSFGDLKIDTFPVEIVISHSRQIFGHAKERRV
jgi:hypothetical protein